MNEQRVVIRQFIQKSVELLIVGHDGQAIGDLHFSSDILYSQAIVDGVNEGFYLLQVTQIVEYWIHEFFFHAILKRRRSDTSS